ncbi:MAG: alpha/beta fold hydrolase [Actinomycetota bacterium]
MPLSGKFLLFFSAVLATTAVGPVSGAGAQAPQIDWNACPEVGFPALQCGTFKVPYDYNKPHGKQFTLALQKLPASGKSEKIGTLFTNPGGPGAPGLESWRVAAESRALIGAFDLIGFDPRGVGDTRPAFKCKSAYGEEPNEPLNSVGWMELEQINSALGAKANRACQSKSADFIAHVGTNNVVRDLDRMRAAVGDAKLTYWGMSYGTRIGYVYAYRYPKKVRAMILDGSVTPDGSVADFTALRSTGGDDALRFIRSVSPATYAAVISTRDSLFASELDLGGGLKIGAYVWLGLVVPNLLNQNNWPKIKPLAGVVAQARRVGQGGNKARQQLRRLLGVVDEAPAGGLGAGANNAINCADYADRPSARKRLQIVRTVFSKAPVFGGQGAAVSAPQCVGFTYRPDPVPKIASKASIARVKNLKLVISDSTADAATPLVWGRAMSKVFQSSSEVTMVTGNHVNFLSTFSECVNRPLRLYLLTLKMPPRRTTCAFSAPTGLDMGAAAARKGEVDPKAVVDSLIRSYRRARPLS